MSKIEQLLEDYLATKDEPQDELALALQKMLEADALLKRYLETE